MTVDIASLFRTSQARRKGTKLLTLPVLERLRDPRHQLAVDKLIRAAAETVAATHLLYRWKRTSGLISLCQWDKTTRVFTMLDNSLFAEFVGEQFDLTDGKFHFGLPHRSTTDRLYAEMLKDSINLPIADWRLTDEFRKGR